LREEATHVRLRAVYAPRYQTERGKLSRATRTALDFVEEQILDDPGPRHHRRELSDGAVVDFSAQDLLVRYRRLSAEAVEFERVLDLRSVE
jgi:hypothetical protein